MNPLLAQFIALIRRYPYCAACTVVTLLLGGIAWFLIGQNEDLEAVRMDRAKEGEAMLTLLVGGSTQRQ